MDVAAFLATAPAVLAEGSVYERLRRDGRVAFDPHVAHAALIYDAVAESILAETHRAYFGIARRHGLPLIAFTDTWRANGERVRASRFSDRDVNEDNARFLCELRDAEAAGGPPILVAGTLGPRGDAYRPEHALRDRVAAAFHTVQARAFLWTDVDLLLASTLPAVTEAIGLARAMSVTGLPYLLSFVVRADGTVLDGTPLPEAIDRIDDLLSRPPAGYLVNCVHPTVFAQALAAGSDRATLRERVLGLQANTAALRPEDLDAASDLVGADPEEFGDRVGELLRTCGTRILGGCCGTGPEHIEAIARRLRRAARGAASEGRGE